MRKIKTSDVDVVMTEKTKKFLENVVCDSVNDWLAFYFGKNGPLPKFFFEHNEKIGTFSYAAGPDCECMAYGVLSEMVEMIRDDRDPLFMNSLASEFERLAKILRETTQ